MTLNSVFERISLRNYFKDAENTSDSSCDNNPNIKHIS